MSMGLAQVRHWVFDMDGTLTLAVHDFAAIRRALEITAGEDILEHIAALPEAPAQAKRAWLLDHERGLAEDALPAPGAVALLRALAAAGCRLGILTRNDHALAKLTLDAIGVGGLFGDADIIGRDEAVPKPSPDGLQQHLRRWGIAASEAVMVGDHAYDLDCGRAAGTRTVLVNLPENPWPGSADWHFTDCHALLAAWQQRG
ncbi:TPA: HAD family hydrolase [Stenotrophomonas maltophilia]|nr:HAD family hydrolase [Stenotrophomonas maltophilia]